MDVMSCLGQQILLQLMKFDYQEEKYCLALYLHHLFAFSVEAPGNDGDHGVQKFSFPHSANTNNGNYKLQ